MDIKERINELRSAKGLSVKAFEQEIGISNGLWEKAKSLSEDVLIKVVAQYPDINPCWLLKGEGDMFGEYGDRSRSNNMVDVLKAENESLKKEIAVLKAIRGKDKTLEVAMKLYQALGEAFTAYYEQIKGE